MLASHPVQGATRSGSFTHDPTPSSSAFQRCGTPDPTPREIDECRQTLEAGRGRIALGVRGGTVRLAIHILTCGGDGDVSDAAVADQITELNRAFGLAQLRFEL